MNSFASIYVETKRFVNDASTPYRLPHGLIKFVQTNNRSICLNFKFPRIVYRNFLNPITSSEMY